MNNSELLNSFVDSTKIRLAREILEETGSSAITASADCNMTLFGIPFTPGIFSFCKALDMNTLSAALVAKAADVPVNIIPAD